MCTYVCAGSVTACVCMYVCTFAVCVDESEPIEREIGYTGKNGDNCREIWILMETLSLGKSRDKGW